TRPPPPSRQGGVPYAPDPQRNPEKNKEINLFCAAINLFDLFPIASREQQQKRLSLYRNGLAFLSRCLATSNTTRSERRSASPVTKNWLWPDGGGLFFCPLVERNCRKSAMA